MNIFDNQQNQRPIHYAVDFGYLDIIQLLIEAGCDIHTANIFRETPLQIAQRKDSTKIIQLLQENGATH